MGVETDPSYFSTGGNDMDIQLDRPGDPHWLSKPVCMCELDREVWRQYLRNMNDPRAVSTYTPIAKLCVLHAAAPVLLKALEDILAWADVESHKRAVALVKRIKDAHGVNNENQAALYDERGGEG